MTQTVMALPAGAPATNDRTNWPRWVQGLMAALLGQGVDCQAIDLVDGQIVITADQDVTAKVTAYGAGG